MAYLDSETPPHPNGFHPPPYDSTDGPSPLYSTPSSDEQVLGLRMLDTFRGFFSSLWSPSHTVLHLDLRRPLSFGQPVSNTNWVSEVQGARARLQLMQVWDFSQRETEESAAKYGFNLGFGGSIEMEGGGVVVPKARLKAKYATLHVLPSPCFELRWKFPLGISSLGASLRCRVPLTDLEKVWDSPTSQLRLDFYNQVGSGFHLTPGGIEFDEHVMKLGKYTSLRVAASINFPRRFPLDQDEQPFKIDVHRIGIKTRMM